MKKKWNKIQRGSKITLLKNKIFNSFNGRQVLKKGQYYINGFWANACGLSVKRHSGQSDYVIPSIQLKKFEEVI